MPRKRACGNCELPDCRPCKRAAYYRAYYAEHGDKVRARVREYSKNNPDVRRERVRRWRDSDPDAYYAAKRAEYERNRDRYLAQFERDKRENTYKWRAREKFHYAIRAGRIVREPCEVCGAEPAEGHHEDYAKPLEVRWLCRDHHAAVHRKEAA